MLLLIIDMQRDFLEPGGFGHMLRNDVMRLTSAVDPCRRLLGYAQAVGMKVIHTREGHRPDLSDLYPYKGARPAGCGKDGNDDGKVVALIGTAGPRGRIMVRGEVGHKIIP